MKLVNNNPRFPALADPSGGLVMALVVLFCWGRSVTWSLTHQGTLWEGCEVWFSFRIWRKTAGFRSLPGDLNTSCSSRLVATSGSLSSEYISIMPRWLVLFWSSSRALKMLWSAVEESMQVQPPQVSLESLSEKTVVCRPQGPVLLWHSQVSVILCIKCSRSLR